MNASAMGILWGITLLLLGAGASGEVKATDDEPTLSSDIVCGPRCVQYLLKSFDPNAKFDLLEIVAKVQPEFERGSSLAHLEQYLNREGLHTLGFQPVPNTVIRWPHPVLLHLSTEDPVMGHFVILLPGSDRFTADVWSGLTGRIRMPSWQLAERIDGALLISPDPIEVAPESFPTTMDATLRRAGWLAIFMISPIVGMAWFSTLTAFRPWAGRPSPSVTASNPPVSAKNGDISPTPKDDIDEDSD